MTLLLILLPFPPSIPTDVASDFRYESILIDTIFVMNLHHGFYRRRESNSERYLRAF
jgi:hypothetical protein